MIKKKIEAQRVIDIQSERVYVWRSNYGWLRLEYVANHCVAEGAFYSDNRTYMQFSLGHQWDVSHFDTLTVMYETEEETLDRLRQQEVSYYDMYYEALKEQRQAAKRQYARLWRVYRQWHNLCKAVEDINYMSKIAGGVADTSYAVKLLTARRDELYAELICNKEMLNHFQQGDEAWDRYHKKLWCLDDRYSHVRSIINYIYLNDQIPF